MAEGIGQNTRLSLEEPAGSGTFIPVPGVKDGLTPPVGTPARRDASNLETPVGGKSYKPAASAEWAACTGEANYDPDAQAHGILLADGPGAGQLQQRKYRIEWRHPITGAVEKTMTWTGSVGKAGLGQAQRDGGRPLAFEINVDEMPTYA